MSDKATIVHCLGTLFLLSGFRYAEGEANKSTACCGSVSTDKGFCPTEEVDAGEYGTFEFPQTKTTVNGTQLRVECPFGIRNDGLESIYDGQLQTWESKKSVSGALRTCILEKSDGDEMMARWHPLPHETQINYCKREGRENVLNLWNRNLETHITSNTFKNLVTLMPELLQYTSNDYDCALALINGIDLLMRSPNLGPDVITKTDRGQVLAYVNLYKENIESYLPPGFKSKVGNGGIVVETARLDTSMNFLKTARRVDNTLDFGLEPYKSNLFTLNSTEIDIVISVQALQMSMSQISGKDSPFLTITVYSEEIFKWGADQSSSTESSKLGDVLGVPNYNETFPQDCITTTITDEKDTSTPHRSLGLLSIELDGNIENLAEPIEYTISNNVHNPCEHKMTCVYLDETTQMWSTAGVETIKMDNGVKCKSTHLTAFSALIEPLPLPFPDAEYAPVNNSVHGHILSILSSIGSVCSIVGLSFTLLTYGLFRCLRRERSNRILINLCTSLLLLHIMSVSGSKNLWDDHCFVPSVSLHYLVLTSLAWMMVEAVHMFQLLISVFVRPENQFLIKRVVLAWGVPLIIVGVCAAMEPKVYQVGRADLCLMSGHENIVLYYAAYIFPICIMLLVNIIIFCRIFQVLYKQTKRTNCSTKGQGKSARPQFTKISPSQIKGAITVLILLGIGWTLGLLAMGPFEVLFRYLYCVCNAGQGLFIFIFRVLLNPHASKQWKKVILGLSSDNFLDVSVTTSTTTGIGKGKKRKNGSLSSTDISASNSVQNSLTPSNPLSATLAETLASILRSEDARAAGSIIDDAK